MKKLLLSTMIASAICVSSMSMAQTPNTFDIGMRGGWLYANIDDSDAFNDEDHNGIGYGIFGEYTVDPVFTLGLGYNILNGASVTDVKTGAENDIDIQGPEIYAKFAYGFEQYNTDVYGKVGLMYAVAHGEGTSSDSKNAAPVIGVGAQYNMPDSKVSFRVGYDYYFNVYDGDGNSTGVDSDLGLFYAGVAYKL